jgi:hypothetical protein
MDLNNKAISLLPTYSNLSIDTKTIETLTTYASNQDLFKLSLNEFESKIHTMLKRCNAESNIDLIDVLFKPDERGFNLLLYMVNDESNHPLFSSILEKYQDQLKNFLPNEWGFMIWVNPNECHNSLTKFYGKNVMDKIVDMKKNVLYYSVEHFTKYYLQDKLDYFYKIDNMKLFNKMLTKPMLHLLNFFEADTEGFKKFMFDNKSSDNLGDLALITSNDFNFENLMLKHYSVRSINHYVSIFLPNEKEFNILVAKWGNEKASKVISDFINFQNEYILSFNDNNDYPFKFEREIMKSLINAGINFNNCGKSLAFGLRDESEIMSYLIINDIIKKDDLLININDSELKIKAEHYMLDLSLDKKIDLPKKKVKL